MTDPRFTDNHSPNSNPTALLIQIIGEGTCR